MSTRCGPQGAVAYNVTSQSRPNRACGAHTAVGAFRRPQPKSELGLASLEDFKLFKFLLTIYKLSNLFSDALRVRWYLFVTTFNVDYVCCMHSLKLLLQLVVDCVPISPFITEPLHYNKYDF